MGNRLAVPTRFGATTPVSPASRRRPCEPAARSASSRPGRRRIRAVDCFYVYPTISGQSTINANLQVGLPGTPGRERAGVAVLTGVSGVRAGLPADHAGRTRAPGPDHPRRCVGARTTACSAAFHDYLAHYNDGRGIVFVGHSQGAVILIRLLQREVDLDATLRRRLVSALLLGGNVTVAKGRSVGGSFSAHSRVRLAATDRLRRRVLELHIQTADEQPVRPHDLGRWSEVCSRLARLDRTFRSSASIPVRRPAVEARSIRMFRRSYSPSPGTRSARRRRGSPFPAVTAAAAGHRATPIGSRSPTAAPAPTGDRT